jgi:hypothetical protein
MPRAGSDKEPDFVTGWFHERLLERPVEEQAEDQQRPEQAETPLRPAPERWATGSPWHRRHAAASEDLPDYEAECEDPPDRERL